MDFGFTPENEAFRREVRAFIAEHVTPARREELARARREGPARWRGSSSGSSRTSSGSA